MVSKKTDGARPDPASFLANFEWPEFNSDSKRLKAYTKRYKGLSITEAFEKCYNLSLNDVPEAVNYIPRELNVGDILKTRILSVSKGQVLFDTTNFKTSVQSSVNLYKYEKLRHFLPLDELDAIVLRKDKDKVVIDPISPMVNRWLDPILNDPTIQKVIPNEETGATIHPVIVKNLQLTKGGFIGKAVIPTASELIATAWQRYDWQRVAMAMRSPAMLRYGEVWHRMVE